MKLVEYTGYCVVYDKDGYVVIITHNKNIAKQYIKNHKKG